MWLADVRARSQFVDGVSSCIHYQPTFIFEDQVLIFFFSGQSGFWSYDEIMHQKMSPGFWPGEYGYLIIIMLL